MEAIDFPIVRKMRDEIWTEKVYEVNVPSLTGEARALSIKYFLFKNKDTQTATQQKKKTNTRGTGHNKILPRNLTGTKINKCLLEK